MYSIRARLIQEMPGKFDGKGYAAVRHYSTLTLPHTPLTTRSVPHQLADLPQGVTSFGAAVSNNALYVYGGNYGTAHEYSQDGQSNDLWKLDLVKPAKWKKVSKGPKLQGLAMVAHEEELYRLGGFTAMNKSGEDQDLRSQSSAARFSVADGKWTELPPLPEPRSSFDAAVVGGVLYVAGGWNMPGKGNDAVWHKTAYAMDLKHESLVWKPIAAPNFVRRALALGACHDKLVCIGGMQQSGGASTRVDIYDPKTKKWSKGPSLIGGSLDGFGSSAFAVDSALYVSTLSGSVQRLTHGATKWDLVGQLDHPRFFHRLLQWKGPQMIAVGGGNMSTGKVLELDRIDVE